ncbi:MAG: NADPH-dependent glutamate synthase [Candidatus Omnitrophota bacterium]
MSNQAQDAAELPAIERAGCFDEVVLGYSEDEALTEARRCLQCRNPLCVAGCPVGIDIKKFISEICQKDYKAAYLTIKEKNNFASICGRVCPAEYQCRKACVLTKKGQPFASKEAINIHFLERFAGDYGMRHHIQMSAGKQESMSCHKVAVIGSGPAGLSCAGELAGQGVHVDIFESLHAAGGVLRYGIPAFRLPRNVLDSEIDSLKKYGVSITTNFVAGFTRSLEEFFALGYEAVFLGLGAGVPSFLNVPGENLCNIYSANEFLTRVNLMRAYKFPEFHTPVNIGKKIVVIGGGNTAMDAARAAVRLQKMRGEASNTRILYRRTDIEMPARRLEIEHASQEGVGFDFLVQPKAFMSDDKGFVKGIQCLRCELGSPDASGRRKPVSVEGSDFMVEADLVIIAAGLKANQLLTRVTPQLKTDQYHDVVVNPETMETSVKGVFAGGDIVGGEGTVIEAMGMGKKAAQGILGLLTAAR